MGSVAEHVQGSKALLLNHQHVMHWLQSRLTHPVVVCLCLLETPLP
jgi:hypothetical protein